LSGGIDSALVAKYCSMHSSRRLKAFTVGFGNDAFADETIDAKESADIIGLDYVDVNIGFDDFLGTLQKCINIVEEPSATTSIVPMYYLSKLASDNVKVVLSGQGADEPLGGYRRYQSELIQKWIPHEYMKFLLPIVKKLGITNEAVIRGISSLSYSDDVSRFLSTSRVFDDKEISLLLGDFNNKSSEKISYFYDLLNCSSRAESVERMMSVDLRMNLSDDLLLYTDKITMHHSLECRVPMLDNDLIEFLESIPASYRLKFRKSKIIHKDFAQKALPDKIINRTKKGFLSPTKKWFKNKGVIGDLLLNKSSKFADHFNLNYVENVIDQHIAGYNRERHIFLLLSTYFWLEEFS